jgi:nitroreductase
MDNETTPTPETLALILQRRSIRRYQDRPVEPEKLELLLRAAMAAPSACSSRPWEFIVITEREVLDRLREKLLFARYNAPAAIAVLGNLGIANNSAAKTHWVQDCSAAIENMLIAAPGLGLGAVWIGVYPLPSAMGPVRKILEIPDDIIPLSLVYVGYPAEEKPPRTAYDPHRVFWQHYEPRKRRAKVKNAKREG